MNLNYVILTLFIIFMLTIFSVFVYFIYIIVADQTKNDISKNNFSSSQQQLDVSSVTDSMANLYNIVTDQIKLYSDKNVYYTLYGITLSTVALNKFICGKNIDIGILISTDVLKIFLQNTQKNISLSFSAMTYCVTCKAGITTDIVDKSIYYYSPDMKSFTIKNTDNESVTIHFLTFTYNDENSSYSIVQNGNIIDNISYDTILGMMKSLINYYVHTLSSFIYMDLYIPSNAIDFLKVTNTNLNLINKLNKETLCVISNNAVS